MSNTEETNGMQPILHPKINTIIKVIGVGGGGCNAINHIIDEGLGNVEFITVNTDPQILLQSKASIQVLIREKERCGLDGGGDPLRAEKAAEDSADELYKIVCNADLVFIIATMGGGAGTGAAPVVARFAKQTGALTVGVVTRPFTFEGTRRMQKAFNGINHLKQQVDTLIIFHDDWLHEIDNHISVIDAFKMIDHILFQRIKGISDLITVPNLICLDFNDIRSILSGGGLAVVTIGKASGEDRARIAAAKVISSQPKEFPMKEARSILVNFTSGPHLALFEVSQAIDIIRDSIDPKVRVLFGAQIDPDMEDEFQVTTLAVGYDSKDDRESSRRFPDMDI